MSASDKSTETEHSTEEEHLCGICRKEVPDANTKQDQSFTKKCPLCDVEYYHCMQCVKKYVNGFNNRGRITNISIEDFQASKVKYYCKSCEDLKCPQCDKRHQRSKFNILTFFNFFLYHCI